jgi:hypothetical protein
MLTSGRGGRRPGRVARAALAVLAVGCAGPATAGSIDLFGLTSLDYKLTLGYAVAMRMEDPDPALIDGPIDVQQVTLNTDPLTCPTLPAPCIGSFGHTGMPTTILFDDGNRDFRKGALLNNRVSAYGEAQLKLDWLGLGDVGLVGSGAAHYDQSFQEENDHDSPDTVNRISLVQIGPTPAAPGFPGFERVGPTNTWHPEAVETNGERYRLLEAYAYGQWYLTDTIGVALRAGKHLAAWGESLFFPGIASAQGPFDATKANVPGVEVKEILLPVNQVSLQMSLMQGLEFMAYNQFEFEPTEVYPQGDFFSPADLIGPGANFGYGSINPLHPDWCDDPSRVQITNPGAQGNELCVAGQLFTQKPRYIMTPRTADDMPGEAGQWGVGLKYQLPFLDLNLGGYYLEYKNHNPNVALNMGYAYVGASGNQAVTTEQFNVKVPVTYTVGYADDVRMAALSFSTVFWVFNMAGEITHRMNVDTSLEATISGVVAPVGTRGDTTTAQASFLYVNNPNFLIYDEVVVVAEFGYTMVDRVDPRRNEDGICYSGTDTPGDANGDCAPGKPDDQYVKYGSQLFYDRDSYAFQALILPKGRNVFPGWDIGTPINLAWLVEGTPSTPGVFGALYAEGDQRASLGVTAQYLQNLEFALSYNAFFGDANKHIRNSTLKANPYVDHDYLALSIKYNL